MRHNHVLVVDYGIAMYHVSEAVRAFYDKHHISPDTVKLLYQDYQDILGQMAQTYVPLEKGKQYGIFMAVPGGMVELVLLNDSDESFSTSSNINMNGMSTSTSQRTTVIVVESTQLDREFEKHVLNKE